MAKGAQKHLLREGQVLVAVKGYRNFAWAYREEDGPCVASISFYVLDVNNDLVLAPFLSLVLNSASRVRALNAIATGTSIPAIPKKELLNLSVPVPPIDAQKSIIRARALQLRRDRIYRDLLATQRSLDDAVITQLLTK